MRVSVPSDFAINAEKLANCLRAKIAREQRNTVTLIGPLRSIGSVMGTLAIRPRMFIKYANIHGEYVEFARNVFDIGLSYTKLSGLMERFGNFLLIDDLFMAKRRTLYYDKL